MKKIVSVIFIFLSWCSLHAQSFPGFNASSGNEAEFPIDADTNMYIFHGSRLVKTDKDFVSIWSNTYGNIIFTHVLLSKSGSIYFIGGDNSASNRYLVGKINKNGVLSWCKNLSNFTTDNGSYTIDKCNSILLDRDTNLIITGNTTAVVFPGNKAFFLKTDTNGNALKFKCFGGWLTSNFSITHDSSGYYHFFGAGVNSMDPGFGMGVSVYDDVNDVFLGQGRVIGLQASEWRLVRSRFNTNFYLFLSRIYDSNFSTVTTVGLQKLKMGGMPLWGLRMSNYDGSGVLGYARGMIESSSGDLYYHLESCCGAEPFGTGLFKIDMSGNMNTGVKVIASFNPTLNTISSHAPQIIYGSKLYTDLVTSNHPINPLNIISLDYNSPSSCFPGATCSYSSLNTGLSSHPTATIDPVSSATLSAYFPTASPTTFSITSNTCAISGLNESVLKPRFTVFPNPASTLLSIENISYDHLSVSDMFGKIVLEQNYYASKISVQHLSNGLYFLQLRSGNNYYTGKFTKE
jgi:hypothetical protein